MITVTLLNDSTLALSGGYEQKNAIKALEGATWDRKEKRWLVPVRCAALVRMGKPEHAEALGYDLWDASQLSSQ